MGKLLFMLTFDHGYVPFVVITILSFPPLWFITGFVTRVTRRMLLVEQELITVPEHLRSSPVFSGVRGTLSLVFYTLFCRSLFSPLSVFLLSLCCTCLSFDLRNQNNIIHIFFFFKFVILSIWCILYRHFYKI
jgi:hypothetical protein